MPRFDYEKIHFGFLIGFNAFDFQIYNTGARTLENGQVARYGEVLKLSLGLNLGIVTDLRLCKNVNLRALPGIGFGQRDITFINEYGDVIGEPLQIKSTFVELPILVRYGAYRFGNVKPYICAGTTTRYDLAKAKQDHLVLKSLDQYWDLGAGFDFYLPYFRFSIELRGSFGLANVYNASQVSEQIEDLPYQQAISKLKSRIVGLTFYFE